MIYFAIGLYLLIGLGCSYYGTSFIRVDYDKRYCGISEPFDAFIMIYMYVCITFLWLGFVFVLTIINFFEKGIFEDLHNDFIGVINHQYGELENPIERW